MGQGPFNSLASQKYGTTTFVPLNSDNEGNLLSTKGGAKSLLNITAASVVKAAAGRIAKLIILNPGSAAGVVVNDAATTGAAASSNEIFTLAHDASASYAGAVIDLDFPCANGIVVSAIGTGGVYAISFT